MDVFDLRAKITMDTSAYEKALSDSSKKADSFLSGLGGAFTKAGDVLLTTAKTTAAAVGTVGTAIGGLTKKSLDSFAEFEQLEGGTALMFGKAYDFVMEKSAEAYQTVQMSQNEYLQQVNGFAVGLKTALGGNEQAAAELADKIITAEADIVAATGNSQEAVQNAFNGIMKSNYTMLDNLQLGITPTKEGMQEVIDKVNAWNAANGKASSYVIDNLADVQSALVDYVKMQGLSGYASKEASQTIQGSIAGMKAAWQNFLTGTGTAKQFTDMLGTVAGNIKPKVKEIVPRLTEGLTELVDLIAPEVPALIEDTLPTLIDASANLLTKMAPRIPQVLSVLAPSLISGVVQVIEGLGSALPQLAPELVHLGTAAITQIWKGMKSAGNGGESEGFIEAFTAELKTKLPYIKRLGGDIVGRIKDGLIESTAKMSETAVTFVSGLASKIADSNILQNIGSVAGDVVFGFAEGLSSQSSIDAFLEAAPKFLTGLGEGIKNFLVGEDGDKGLLGAVEGIINSFADWFEDEENTKEFEKAADEFIDSLGDAVCAIIEKVPDILLSAGRLLLDVLIGNIDYDHGADEFWSSLITSIWNGLKRWELPFGGEEIAIQEAWQKYNGDMSYDEFKNKWYDVEDVGDALFGISDQGRARKMGYAIDIAGNVYDPSSGLSASDWERVYNTRAVYESAAKYSDSDLLEWLNAGSTMGFDEFFSDYERRRRYREAHPNQYVPGFASGGIVTKPTFAMIGEEGPEAVVPLTKDSETGRMLSGVQITFGDIIVQGGADAGRAVVRQIDEALRMWQIQQNRGIGGTAWT